MKAYRMFIDGAWADASNGAVFQSDNPFTGAAWAQVPHATDADVDRAVRAAKHAFEQGPWSRLTATERGALLRKFADLLAERADALAEVEVRDNGKLLSEMRAQARYIPQGFHYYAGMADKICGEVVSLDRPDSFGYTRPEPMGVVAAITPWNSPLLLAVFKLAPALAAGNTIVWKPSEHASCSALEFCALAAQSGIPPGVINVVTGVGAEVGDRLARHPDVAKVAFTGGEAAGRAVYRTAADGFKRVTLELGGKSANIVFADADLDAAVNGAIAGIFAASGQTCIAGSRLLLEAPIYDRFLEKLIAKAAQARIGDPMAAGVQVGPITTRVQYEKILSLIAIAEAEGARCVLGGRAANSPGDGGGYFIEPTIFVDVDNTMRIAREEVFGPVLCVLKFNGEDEAASIANDSPYGLAAGVWTENLGRALRMERRLKVGTVWVNTYRALSFHLPFGGPKASGVGRENGRDAMLAFMEPKSVLVNIGPGMADPFSLQ